MNLADALAAPPTPPLATRALPKIGEPGTFEWDGAEGTVNTRVVRERPTTWDSFLSEAGLDPEIVEVIEPVSVRGRVDPEGVMHFFYSLRVKTRVGSRVNADELIAVVNKKRAAKLPDTGDSTFLVAFADLQLGKVDGDGVAGTWQRALDAVDKSIAQLKSLRRAKHSVGPVLVSWLGDGCEGFVSQNGNNAWRTQLSLTEQIRLERRFMYHVVEQFAPLTDSLIMAGVSGNHDEAVRLGGKGITKYSDSFDIEALATVQDAIKLNDAAYGHVRTYTPGDDELTLTLETSGTIVGMAHGHMWGSPAKTLTWWQKQAFGDQPIGQADILLTGHFHHFRVEQQGQRTWIQAPSLESESTYYRHRNGVPGMPGVLTGVLRDHKAQHLYIA